MAGYTQLMCDYTQHFTPLRLADEAAAQQAAEEAAAQKAAEDEARRLAADKAAQQSALLRRWKRMGAGLLVCCALIFAACFFLALRLSLPTATTVTNGVGAGSSPGTLVSRHVAETRNQALEERIYRP